MSDSGETRALTVREERTSFAPRTMAEAMQFAEAAAASDFVPKDFRGKPGNVLLALQMGSELGLAPMQAIQNIAVINGRPAVWGDAALAIVRAHPACVDVVETYAPQTAAATCTVQRRGCAEVVRSFSQADAQRAGLWGKGGPWAQYPQRMLQLRARGFALRDSFPDALRGLITAEEAHDYQSEAATMRTVTAVVEEPAQKPQPRGSQRGAASPVVSERPERQPAGEAGSPSPAGTTPAVSAAPVPATGPSKAAVDDGSEPTLQEMLERFRAAEDRQALFALRPRAGRLPTSDKATAWQAYLTRQSEFDAAEQWGEPIAPTQPRPDARQPGEDG